MNFNHIGFSNFLKSYFVISYVLWSHNVNFSLYTSLPCIILLFIVQPMDKEFLKYDRWINEFNFKFKFKSIQSEFNVFYWKYLLPEKRLYKRMISCENSIRDVATCVHTVLIAVNKCENIITLWGIDDLKFSSSIAHMKELNFTSFPEKI